MLKKKALSKNKKKMSFTSLKTKYKNAGITFNEHGNAWKEDRDIYQAAKDNKDPTDQQIDALGRVDEFEEELPKGGIKYKKNDFLTWEYLYQMKLSSQKTKSRSKSPLRKSPSKSPVRSPVKKSPLKSPKKSSKKSKTRKSKTTRAIKYNKLNAYYVRILKIQDKLFKVQWIDDTTSWIENVHKHMIDDYEEFINDNPSLSSRPKLTKKQLIEEKLFIEKQTEICGSNPKIAKDSADCPLIGVFDIAYFCDECDKWYAKNCLVHNELPCNHEEKDQKEEKEEKKENFLDQFRGDYEQTLKEINDKISIEFKSLHEPSSQRELLLELKLLTKEGKWLNDLLINQIAKQQEDENTISIDSQFVRYLQENEASERMKIKFRKQFHEKKLILIPFNEVEKDGKGIHWRAYLVVIDNEKKASVFDFDSLKQTKPRDLPNYLKEFLVSIIDEIEFVNYDLVELSSYQKDGSSCGIFVANWFQSFHQKKNQKSWMQLKPIVYKYPSKDARLTVFNEFLKQI